MLGDLQEAATVGAGPPASAAGIHSVYECWMLNLHFGRIKSNFLIHNDLTLLPVENFRWGKFQYPDNSRGARRHSSTTPEQRRNTISVLISFIHHFVVK
jgi:hypothetical protein